MLDINLGKETSEEVAELLTEKATPFILASGYGDRSLTAGRFSSAPVITKPYSLRDVRGAISRLPGT